MKLGPLPFLLAAAAAWPTPGWSQDRSSVEAVVTGVMTTCYGQVAGGDPRAAVRSIAAGDLKVGAPQAFPAESLSRLMMVPGGVTVTAYNVPTSAGAVLVVDAPAVALCSVALSGADGEPAGTEIDRWFNGAPSPYTLISDDTTEGKRVRIYRGAERPGADLTLMTTTLADGAEPDQPVRFLATLARVQ